ncbi:agmatine deiminase family protein [Streptomyces noursei]|uniref:agmatine deiminase family protein n=1 Tax=Streptomyces noursei TaxID=1971 RepID=UPI00332BB147
MNDLPVGRWLLDALLQFGDVRADAAARRTLAEAFPGRQVAQLDVDRLMGGGGGIHCATMHQPAP